jgi:hypothetical protein
MLIVEDGTIVSNANSYVDLDDVMTYAVDYGYTTTWSGAGVTDTLREQYILKAMRYIEGLSYRGVKQTASQPLSFPRSECIDNDGYTLDENYIPPKLISAVCEAAFLMVPDAKGNLEIDLQPNISKDDYQTGLQVTGAVQEVWNFNSDEIRNRSTIIEDLLKDLVKNRYSIEIKRG